MKRQNQLKRVTKNFTEIAHFDYLEVRGVESEKGGKFLDRHPGCSDQGSQRSRRQFGMLRHRQARDMTPFEEDDMAASATINSPTGAFE
jgi:hypothetical protein